MGLGLRHTGAHMRPSYHRFHFAVYYVNFTTVNDKGDTVTKRRTAVYFYATIPGKDYPKKPRVAQVFKDEDEMDNHIGGRKKQRREDEVDQTISASAFKPPSIVFISATGLVEMRKNSLFQWLESRCLTVSRDALTCCDIRILVKPHGWILLTRMTRMACVSVPLYSRYANNACSYAKPTFLP
jgi:hypothetical protein